MLAPATDNGRLSDSLQGILTRFPGKRVMVVGDLMLDEYLWGTVRRISPEAPVPIVELQKRSHVPGGAANTAANCAGLQAQVSLVGVIGGDQAGQHLLTALQSQGIDTTGVLLDESRPTTTKTRILAHGQQVGRFDHEERAPLPGLLQMRLLRIVKERLAHTDVCLLSDYAKGVVSPPLAQRLLRRANERGKPVIADPKGSDFAKYRGCTLVKPNLHEAEQFLHREVATEADVLEVGRSLRAHLGQGAVLLTRGSAGMTLFTEDADAVHIEAQAREVYDVTGAGDTVAATLAVALAAGANLEQAARLASQAAGIIVGRVGTAAVRLADLLAAQPAELPAKHVHGAESLT